MQGQSRVEAAERVNFHCVQPSLFLFCVLSQHTTQHVQLQRIQKGKQYKQTEIY